MQQSTNSQENRSFFQWVNFVIPYLYTAGIILVLTWMIVASLLIGIETFKENPKAFILQSDEMVTPVDKQETAFAIIVKPFVESDFNKIIFRGLFLLFIWMVLFLIIPVAFKRLKRFRFFNLEFEVDDIEKAAIETVEISGTKAQLMAYLTGDDASGRTLDFLIDSSIDYGEVLAFFLSEIQLEYNSHPLFAAFSYEICNPVTFPEELNDLIEESKETRESVVRNKINDDNLFKKNYLVFYFNYNNDEYITLISSYTYSFDILDKYLFEVLHQTIAKNIENIEYMVTLTTSE
ncbi:hypothetical protein [Sporosarcina sp. NPDC096371]|uniref:hypothetical protein n=1 Tax=Sporosarcina sp. NPDC096371 TaxID=3364530 RepID=UPI0037FA1F06